MTLIPLAAISDIPPNTPRSFNANGRRIIVVNLDGQFHALDDLCPHLAVPLSRGEIKEGCIVCPGHGSAFNLQTGQAERWVGKSITWLTRLTEGKAENAHCHKLHIEEGQLFVEL
jgi:nitrite reductase/ring-hydroxylating ferredoxin subunit